MTKSRRFVSAYFCCVKGSIMSDPSPDREIRKSRRERPVVREARSRPNGKRRRTSKGGSGRVLFYGLPALAFVLIITLFIVAFASPAPTDASLQGYEGFDNPQGLIDRDHRIPLVQAQPGEESEPSFSPTILVVDPEPTGEEPAQAEFDFVYVISPSADVYEAADESSALLARMDQYDALVRTGEYGDWTAVEGKKALSGFIKSVHISDTPVFKPRTGGTYYVQNRQVYVREGPGTQYPIEGFALRGMSLTVLEAGESWSRIRTEHGLTGSMLNELFGPVKPEGELTELETGRYLYVNTDAANLREEPSTDAEILGVVFMDERVMQISDNGSWSKVRTEGGVIAYLFNHLLRETPPANPFVKTNRTLYIGVDTANIRKSPTTDSDILARAKRDQALLEIEANDSWSKVKLSDGTIGYVRSDLLTNVKPAPAGFTQASGNVYVITNAANIRSEPNTNCSILVVVRYGDRLTVKAKGPGWTMIETSGGKTGYISSDLISATKPSGQSSGSGSGGAGSGSGSGGSNSELRQRVVDIARSALGVPYRLGGKTMSGMDCSGLVKYTYEAIGYKNIPHGSDPQARQLGTRIPITGKDYSSLLLGDLLFFSQGSGYSHVGIYVGNNQMIHASSGNGGVIITNLANYVAAARVNRVID